MATTVIFDLAIVEQFLRYARLVVARRLHPQHARVLCRWSQRSAQERLVNTGRVGASDNVGDETALLATLRSLRIANRTPRMLCHAGLPTDDRLTSRPLSPVLARPVPAPTSRSSSA